MITKTIAFEPELHEAITKLAKKENRSFSNMVKTILFEKVQK
jgi:predicted CopG family antitoxin